jgi:tetratricopeptide (TPR) repeat protein
VTLVTLLLVLVETTSAGAPRPPLERARTLLASGDVEAAGGAALAALEQRPGSGAAYLVLGMARFRARRYDEALAAFTAARTSPEPPAPGALAFNEAATLFALGRFSEAEGAFLLAGRADPKLVALATLNAALAAGQADAPEHARQLLATAAQMPGADALAGELRAAAGELDERAAAAARAQEDGLRVQAKAALKAGRLDEAIVGFRQAASAAGARRAGDQERAELIYDTGVAELRAGRYHEAASDLAEAVRLAPDEAEFHYTAGIVAIRRDDGERARLELQRALALGLDEEDAADARELLDGLSPGLRAAGSGWRLDAETSGGYDSNVAQLGEGRVDSLSAEAPEQPGGMFVSAGIEAGGARTFGPLFFAELTYGLDQLAYGDESFDPYNLQTHALSARLELTPPGPVRLGLNVVADYQLAGLRTFAAFQRALAFEPQLALDEGEHVSTVLRVAWQRKDATDEADYLDGTRLDLWLGQRWRSRGLRAQLAYRHRREDIGTRSVDLGAIGRRKLFEGRYLVPYGYRSNSVVGELSWWVVDRLHLGLDASLGRLQYQGDNVLYRTGVLGRTNEARRVHREDDRVGVGAELGWRLARGVDVVLRYELMANQSTIDFAFDNKEFTKHTFTLSLAASL